MIGNTSDSWGWPARTFHWVIALMVLIQFSFGLWMSEVPQRSERAFYHGIHASIGISILALMVLRLAWRLTNQVPGEPPGMPDWQKLAARSAHWLLYAVTFATVLAGWMLAGSYRTPVGIKMFGLIDMPQLVTAGSSLHELLEEVHEILAFTLIALVTVHTAVALWHHFGRRDDVLMRMVQDRSKQGT
jgi:cytochrome b561